MSQGLPDLSPQQQLSKPEFNGEWVRLGDILTEYKELNVGNRYRPVAVGRFGIRAREDIYTKELAKDYSKNKVIHQNTLTVGMGSKQIDIGILTSEERYSVSPAYHTYHIGDVDCDYLRYCLEARNADMFKRFAKRGTRQGKTIDLKRWLGYRIYLPSKERQAAVVRRLDAVERQIGDCKAMGQRFDDLVKSQFVEMFGDPIEQPKYQTESLGEACTKIGSGATPRGGKTIYMDNGTPFIRSLNVHNGTFIRKNLAYIGEEEAKKLSNVSLKRGDVLLNITGASVARSCVLPDDLVGGRVNQHVAILRANQSVILPCILNATLTSESYQCFMLEGAQKAGATREAITKQDLERFRVSIPPLSLQQQFADFVAKVDKLGFDVQQQIEKLKILKQSLMQEYFG